MNYLSEIKVFYDLILSKPLSTGQIALWHALMNINNKCTWSEWFTVPNQTLELLTGMSRQAISKNRNVLKQLGYLDFKTNGTKATAYTLNSLQDSCQDSCQSSLQDSCQDSCQNSSTLNKLNETRRDNNIIRVRECYENKIGMMNMSIVNQLDGYAEKMEFEVIEKALDLTADKGAGWTYARAILSDWLNRGIVRKSDLKKLESKRGQAKTKDRFPDWWDEIIDNLECEER